MLDRDQTIERLTKVRDGIRLTLNDESADRQSAIEDIDVELDAILIELTSDERAGIELMIELILPLVRVDAQYAGSLCEKCIGCNDHECRCPAAMKCICN